MHTSSKLSPRDTELAVCQTVRRIQKRSVRVLSSMNETRNPRKEATLTHRRSGAAGEGLCLETQVRAEEITYQRIGMLLQQQSELLFLFPRASVEKTCEDTINRFPDVSAKLGQTGYFRTTVTFSIGSLKKSFAVQMTLPRMRATVTARCTMTVMWGRVPPLLTRLGSKLSHHTSPTQSLAEHSSLT